MAAQKVGATVPQDQQRRQLHQTRIESSAPRLLLRQEQPRKPKGRPRTSAVRNLERETQHCTLPPSPRLKSCECGHGKAIHHRTQSQDNPALGTPCNFPGCKCPRYTPMRVETAL